MEYIDDGEINLLINGHLHFLKNVSVDNVIFGYHEKELKVLLQRPQGIVKWQLPGGYIKRTETLNEAALRVATERTGLDKLFLQQFRSFGTPHRTFDADFTPELMTKLSGLQISADHWMFDYFVSVCFYTLTEFSLVIPNGSFYMEECQWWPIGELPQMTFDHREMVEEALKALRLHIYHYPVGYELLPEKFTRPEIHALYETILGKSLDSRNFGKKLITTGIIKELGEQKSIGAHRSPKLYKFDKEAYDNALKEMMVLV
ncbi:NUDIX hydrolase [Mucilaginibacter sp. SP1R1]|uniref:NUDIX hydrolase n=1 Tax=Mucilaginibacter sp. SP1R1 TaxID=2723091 RepID=UPI0016134952|nr:NUDIX domain-containing protein [Mucilaginibacter sp. SP1R1]MBB6149994.1 ADP-ribose pyrophosphatase YjhB (NUDIX family) [Mucilaginibacter sp. SP1R1]